MLITPFKPTLLSVRPLWLAQAINHLYTHSSISHCLHSPKSVPFMKWSAIYLSPYSSSHPPLSPPSLTHPQPSVSPLPYPPMSHHKNGCISECMIHTHGPSTLSTSLLPPGKKQHGEPSPCNDMTHTQRALNSHPPTPSCWGRPGWRGKWNPETKDKYVDSGGPHQAAMVIDNLTSKHRLTHMPFCWPNTLHQKSTTPLINPMSASASPKMASWFGKLSMLNILMLVSWKTFQLFPPPLIRFLTYGYQGGSCGPTDSIPCTSFCVVFQWSLPKHWCYYWQPGTMFRWLMRSTQEQNQWSQQKVIFLFSTIHPTLA